MRREAKSTDLVSYVRRTMGFETLTYFTGATDGGKNSDTTHRSGNRVSYPRPSFNRAGVNIYIGIRRRARPDTTIKAAHHFYDVESGNFYGAKGSTEVRSTARRWRTGMAKPPANEQKFHALIY